MKKCVVNYKKLQLAFLIDKICTIHNTTSPNCMTHMVTLTIIKRKEESLLLVNAVGSHVDGCRALRPRCGRDGLVNWGLEATNVLNWKIVRVTGLQVFVQNGKDLAVQNLESPDAVHHSLQWLKWKFEIRYVFY